MTKHAELIVHVHHLSVGLDISSSSIVCVSRNSYGDTTKMSRVVQVFPGCLCIKNKQLGLCLCDKFHFHMRMLKQFL